MQWNIKMMYYWSGLKNEVVEYISKFLEFQKFKLECRNPTILLYPIPILEWKWGVIYMDFIIGIPKVNKQHDTMKVVVDKMSVGVPSWPGGPPKRKTKEKKYL